MRETCDVAGWRDGDLAAVTCVGGAWGGSQQRHAPITCRPASSTASVATPTAPATALSASSHSLRVFFHFFLPYVEQRVIFFLRIASFDGMKRGQSICGNNR